MRSRVVFAVSMVVNVVLGLANGQLGAVGTPCYSSGTCFGYTTCQQNRCMCTSGYQQVGQTCVQLGGGMGGVGMGMGGMGGCLPGMSGCGVGAGVLVYPGQPCGGTYGSCGGGSFCQSGICCCPTGYSQTMTGCIPNVGMGMGMGGLGYGMGYGMGGLGYGMSGLGYGMGGIGYGMGLGYGMGMGMGMMPMYGGGMGCMGGCGGGAYCQSGMCVCPQNLIYQNSMCMPMYGGGYGGGFGGFGGMGMGLGGSQIVLSINVGGYCQPYSMMSHCVMGATCVQSTCRCMGDFYSQGMYCIRRRLRKDPKQGSNDEQSNVDNTKPEGNQFNPQPPIETINATTTSSSILNWFSKQ